MRGGRSSRGRGGRGRGDEHSMVTRSGAGKEDSRAERAISGCEKVSEKQTDGEDTRTTDNESPLTNCTEDSSNLEMRVELQQLKTQLAKICQNLEIERSRSPEQNQNGTIDQQPSQQTEVEDFPALSGSAAAANVRVTPIVPVPLTSWKEKVAIPKSPIGITCVEDLKEKLVNDQGPQANDNRCQNSQQHEGCEDRVCGVEIMQQGEMDNVRQRENIAASQQQPMVAQDFSKEQQPVNKEEIAKECEEDEERGWTNVTPKKTARRVNSKQQSTLIQGLHTQTTELSTEREAMQHTGNKMGNRDGNPQIPSVQ
ncbi:unnamed protein product [Amaranthus hypochondriacus]